MNLEQLLEIIAEDFYLSIDGVDCDEIMNKKNIEWDIENKLLPLDILQRKVTGIGSFMSDWEECSLWVSL